MIGQILGLVTVRGSSEGVRGGTNVCGGTEICIGDTPERRIGKLYQTYKTREV